MWRRLFVDCPCNPQAAHPSHFKHRFGSTATSQCLVRLSLPSRVQWQYWAGGSLRGSRYPQDAFLPKLLPARHQLYLDLHCETCTLHPSIHPLIYRWTIHRLTIYRVTIHRFTIHRLIMNWLTIHWLTINRFTIHPSIHKSIHRDYRWKIVSITKSGTFTCLTCRLMYTVPFK